MTDWGNDVNLTIIRSVLCVRGLSTVLPSFISTSYSTEKVTSLRLEDVFPPPGHMGQHIARACCCRVHFLVTHRGSTVFGYGVVNLSLKYLR